MKRLIPEIFKVFSWISFFLYSLILVSIIAYLFLKSGNPFSVKSIFGDADPLKAIFLSEPVFEGLLPAIAGTISLILVSVTIAVPVGISTGIWLSEYADGSLKRTMTIFMDILSGLPSIVIGLFGFSAILFMHKLFPETSPGFSILAAGFSLSFLVIPYLVKSTETALGAIDNSFRMAGPALGASKSENIRYVLLKKGLPGIFSGILLAIARCAEDTAVIMLTGAVASAGMPEGLLGRFEALPFYIYYMSSEYSSAYDLERAYDASVLLIIVCSFLFIISFGFNRAATRVKD